MKYEFIRGLALGILIGVTIQFILILITIK
jgi:hypothetical protein